MVKWQHLCVPKDFGGLGIINTRTFNDSLLLKWVWRILEDKEGDNCCQLLKAKYFRKKSFVHYRGGYKKLDTLTMAYINRFVMGRTPYSRRIRG